MFDALLTGLGLVLQWPAIGYLLLGCLMGIWVGAVPGLGGIIGMVLMLPFTFGMEPVGALALLIGLWTVTATADTITSVMLGIPGTAASQATIMDGFPLAKMGQAARAMGAAFTVSAFGGVFGVAVLSVSLPLVMPLILTFKSPELFILGMLGLTMVGSLSGASIVKGLACACLGLMLGTLGMAETIAIPRYTFDSLYLMDGLPLIPVVMGLFAIPELMDLALKNVSISRVPKEQAEGGGIMDGVRDAVKNWWLVIRCSALGTYVGLLPGLGASIVDWIAYGHAVQTAKDKSKFGKGDIRGVIAPEAANNAIKGGALIPTLTLGIPGSVGTAILLGALIMHGLRPGPNMLDANLHITFSLVWMIVVANMAVAGLLMLWCKQVAKIAFVPGHLIVPGVIVFVFMGAWLGGASMGDWISCLAIGIIGFIMKHGGWPRPPLILALILGNILENSFQISVRVHQGMSWLGRPIVLIVIALMLLSLSFAVYRSLKGKKSQKTEEELDESRRDATISLPFTLLLTISFLWAAIEAIPWPREVKQFPLTIAVPGIALCLMVVFQDLRNLRIAVRKTSGAGNLVKSVWQDRELGPAIGFFTYLVGLILASMLVGQKIALPLFMLVYLRRWGGYRWPVCILYALAGWLFIVLFYHQIMHLVFHPSWLGNWLPGVIPEWLPAWLFV